MSVRKELGHSANDRGAWNERRVLAVLTGDELPAWLRSARAATPAEDGRGIDIVIESDVGTLYVQVKSSRKGAERFKTRRHPIALVVAGDASDEKLRRRVLGAVGELRNKIRKRRGL